LASSLNSRGFRRLNDWGTRGGKGRDPEREEEPQIAQREYEGKGGVAHVGGKEVVGGDGVNLGSVQNSCKNKSGLANLVDGLRVSKGG